MFHFSLVFCLLTSIFAGLPRQELETSVRPFPASSALAEGVSPEALDVLDQLVQGFVDENEIVGAELMVIVNGSSILHQAYGIRDVETESPMETGSVFCVRSMTKPLIGTAIWMLLEEKRFKLNDSISKYLPAFDVEGSKDITIKHLLTHTSGLPMSQIFNADLSKLNEQGGIQAVAELGAGIELGFTPGSAFNYSDQGTDTLTALIEVVTGESATSFIEERILTPLSMKMSACVMTEGHPLRELGCSKYAGAPGAWSKFWSTDQPPIFPFFLGSQGLYSTLEDYARFMDFWSRKGRSREARLLRASNVRKALSPGKYPLGSPTGFPELKTHYGSLMQLWAKTDDNGKSEVVVFGHTGSDGTHAWVFPEQNAMVLYFTQSRGTMSGLQVEEALGQLFLGVPYDPNQAAPPLDQYLGYYWEGPGDLYRGIVRDGDDMSLEIIGKGVVPLVFIGEDRWKLKSDPSTVLKFDRSSNGEVTGYHIGDHMEYRFKPSELLPSVDDLAQRIAEVHRLDLVETLGPIRVRGHTTIDAQNISGEIESLLEWPNKFRYEFVAGKLFERVAYDGETVRYEDVNQTLTTIEGARAQALRQENDFARFGNWRDWHSTLEVIQKVRFGNEEAFLVRTGDVTAPASTLFVSVDSGRLLAVADLLLSPMGRMGRRAHFSDFRDVSGMLLPFHYEIEFANPMIGTVVTDISEIELGADLGEKVFQLE